MVKTLTFFWSPQKQSFQCDQDVSEGHGEIATDPSHDLAHLIIAANGGMAWQPQGDRAQVCWAEYNAVFLEHLFDKTCNAIVFGTSTAVDTLRQTLDYMTWFVTQHYAPFPVPAAIAAQRFFQQIDAYQATRLFPYYLQVKRHERTHTDYRNSEYHLVFQSTYHPAVDELGWLAQWSIYSQLKQAQLQLNGITQDRLEHSRLEDVFEAIAASNDSKITTQPYEPRSDDAITDRVSALEIQQQHMADRLKRLEGAIAQLHPHSST